jgi:thioredoxin reductase (NADPH)
LDLDFGISVDIGGPKLDTISTDVLIIGAGPAGLAAAIYTARAGLNTVVVGKKTDSYLGKGHLIENYPGIPSIKGADLLGKFIEHAQIFGAKIIETEVTDFVLGDPKLITTKKNAISAVAVIIATGKGTARKKLIPGEASFVGMGVSYCSTCDGPLYRGRDVVAIGNNNEAAEDLLTLHQMGCNVTWILDGRDDLKVSPELLKEIRETDILINENDLVKEIKGQEKVESIVIENDKGEKELKVDAVFIFKAIPLTPLFKKAGVKIGGRNCIQVDRMQQTNLSGVFAAGDITCGGMQIVTAAGEGAVAGMQAIKYVRKQKK